MPVPNIILRDLGVRKNSFIQPLISTAYDLRDGYRATTEPEPDPVDPGTDITPNIYHETWQAKTIYQIPGEIFEWGSLNGTGICGIEPNPDSEYYGQSVYYWDGHADPGHVKPDRDYTAKVGDYCFQFFWDPDREWVEQRYSLGAAYDPDMWISYWVKVPDNFIMDINALDNDPVQNNNKWLALWQDGYSTKGDGGNVFMEFRPTSSKGAYLYFKVAPGQNSSGGGDLQSYTDFIRYPEDQGRWMHCVLHARIESATLAGDGVFEYWRRWEDESEYTKIHEKFNCKFYRSETELVGWQAGYFMGWSHTQYAEDTWFLMDDIKWSTESLLPDMSGS